MRMNFKAAAMTAGLAMTAAMTAAPVLADETWNTEDGLIVWDDNFGETAVLMMATDAGVTVRVYVPGLARDVAGGRGTYEGYWIATDGSERCEAQLTGPDGAKSNYWGTFTISFVRDAFPSDWAGTSGACFYPHEATISGQVPE